MKFPHLPPNPLRATWTSAVLMGSLLASIASAAPIQEKGWVSFPSRQKLEQTEVRISPSLQAEMEEEEAPYIDAKGMTIPAWRPHIRGDIEYAASTFDRVTYNRVAGLVPEEEWRDGRPKVILAIGDLSQHSFHKGYVDRGSNIIFMDRSLLNKPGFGILAAHELQHIFQNYFAQKKHLETEEDWLNEGLSRYVEFIMGGELPQLELDRLAASAELMPFGDWPEVTSKLSQAYAQSFLFVKYLADHFGGPEVVGRLISRQMGLAGMNEVEALIVDEAKRGRHQVPLQYASPESLVLNFSMALLLNTSRIGDAGLFLLGSDFHMQTEPLLFKKVGAEWVYEGALKSGEAKYLELVPGNYCLHGESALAFVVSQAIVGGSSQIQPLSGQFCVSENDFFNKRLIVELFGRSEAAAKIFYTPRSH